MIADPSQLPAPLPAHARLEGAQDRPLTAEMHRPSPTEAMFKKKEQKDVELDRKIEALRKKNEALMKRYQEVEEDKKRAEQEGMALQGRRGKAEDLTITINKSANEGRVVTKKSGTGGAATPRATQEHVEGEINPFCAGRGRRRQLLVTTGGNTKGKRIVSEQKGADQASAPGGPKEPAGEEKAVEPIRRGRPPQVSKRDAGVQESEEPGVQALTDLTIPTSKEEQLEYLRWKKEREQIDRERVARHKNAKGQWRRAWDMDKPETVFRERFHREAGREGQARGGRNARRGNPRLYDESRGQPHRNRDKASKSIPTVGSKAKGKDRLTGRARRWDAKEGEDHTQQTAETTLEEFLEELDAFGEPEVEDTPPLEERREETAEQDAQNGVMAGELPSRDEKGCGAGSIALVNGREDRGQESANSEPLPRKATEKKVRFLAEVTRSPMASTSGPKELDTLERDSHHNNATKAGVYQLSQQHLVPMLEGPLTGGGGQEQELLSGLVQGASHPPELVQTESLCSSKASKTAKSDSRADNTPIVNSDLEHKALDASSCTSQFLELSKSSNTRSPGEKIDSSFSVMSMDSESSHRAHKSSTDKAKENGKIV
ncbi:coiled-coil domain-containing protein 9B isoform X2 [Scleropages formosus]|uniref:Coiled-coil domain-containing protein 9B-like n=1 Tax=Scleropages formosus TaxID=113540 RepID=A0A8C9RVB6_SCLFO|nr:coiled-coil domain-containing protein 9B isoform X2 [Scleropages formosus]